MSLEGELNITHVLRGKITSLGAINAPDKSLTIDGASADAKATGDALAKKADKAANGTVLSENADYAEIGWWLDGNPDNEDRTGYFVCIADDVHGTGMRKAKSVDDVRGVVVTEPAFAGGATAEKFDENGQLLPKYDYIGIMGLVAVIDDGSCVVNERCMPNDEGIATASNNNLGYHVIERIDRRSILIAIEPNSDMVQRIKTEVEELQVKDEELQNKTEELQAKDEELESGKVDKEEGKALSTNDFTNEYKEKIDGIEAGANKYVLEEGSVTAEKIADEAVRIRKTNVSVPTSAFKANAGNEDYPYKAAITIDGADGNMKPDVTFGFAEVSSGIFAPIAESFNGGGGGDGAGGVYIYASEIPEADITIPVIDLWR